MGLLAAQEGKNFILIGDPSLNERPMGRVSKPLSLMGGDNSGRERGNKLQSQFLAINSKDVLLEPL